jgi:acyl-CoA reductase-like NAD-dependent aldehyde dehydrogenase
VRRVNFTGSARVGKIVAAIAAKHLRPAPLELGGKAPLLVLDDADLDEAVNAAAFGAFANQGQICMSTERILVDEAVAEAFTEKFAANAARLTAGDPPEGKAVLGAVISRDTVERVEMLIAEAVGQGAKMVAGGKTSGVLMDATVVAGVTPAMRLFREESFGPVVAIIRARGDDALVALANDTEYGLSAAVFSRNIPRALGVARRIKSGICHINGATRA